MSQQYDPYEDAMTPDSGLFFGQVHIEAFQGFFQKGQQGAMPYDELAHGKGQKHYLIIEFTFSPINPQRQIFRISTVKWAAEFNQVLRPSMEIVAEQIAKLKNMTMGQFNMLRELSSMYVKCNRVPRPDNKEGQTWTTMEFVQVYPNEATCRAAWEQETDQVLVKLEDLPFMPEPASPVRKPPTDYERQTFAAFLPALCAQAKSEAKANGTEPAQNLANLLAANPMLAAHFTTDSPEVRKIMK